MSYNPAIHGKNSSKAKRVRRLNPKAGIRHSDIVARRGLSALTHQDYQNKIPTQRGWKVEQFKGKNFEVIYEFICAGNSTGVVVHKTAERTIRVLSGELYVILKDGQIENLHTGKSITFPKKTEYTIATSGTGDAEVLFCQDVNYESGLKSLGEPVFSTTPNISYVTKNKQEIGKPVPKEKAKMQARKMSQNRDRRQRARAKSVPTENGNRVTKTPPRLPPVGQQIQGVNPRPIGVSGASELE